MKRFRNAIVLLTLILTTIIPSRGVTTGEWILHPSLDIYSFTNGISGQSTNNIQKLMDGERYVYAIVTANYFANTKSVAAAVRNSYLNIARLDKNDPDAKLEPLLPALPLSGRDVLTAEYCHQAGCIAVAYTNGCIDFIFDDGRIISNKDMASVSSPGGKKVTSVSFTADGKTAVIATCYGIVLMNPENARITDAYNLQQRVEFANIVGNNVLAATTDSIHFFPRTSHPLSLSSLPVLTANPAKVNANIINADRSLKPRYGIYPVDDRSFVYIGTRYNSVDGLSGNLVVIPENPAEEDCMVDYFFSDYVQFNTLSANTTLAANHIEDGLVSRTRDGLMVHSQDRIVLFNYRKGNPVFTDEASLRDYLNANTVIHFKDPVAYTDVQSGQQKYKITATSDGENFYYFVPRKGLMQRKVVSTDVAAKKTTWETVGDVHEINACPAGLPAHLSYTPEYGITVHNQGKFTNNSLANGMADGLATYRNGKWTQQSLAHRNFSGGFLYGSTQVCVLPCGGIHDPNDPKYIYTATQMSGLRRENLEDPTDLLLLTTGQYMTSLPYRYPVVERMVGSTWSTLCAFSLPSFDNEGRMWTSFDRLVYPAMPEEHGELWYWTAEDRAACATAADYAAHPMKIINVPGVCGSAFASAVVAAREEKNRNLVLYASDNDGAASYILDHNGTLDDSSDDRVAILKNMIDENGDEHLGYFQRMSCIFEDPYDGTFIIGHRTGIITMTREQAFNYEKPHFTFLNPENGATNSLMSDFGAGGVAQICVDKDLNKWIAMKNGGLVCLSPDRSRILAWYDTENSDIPGNELYSVVYNPETNSIFTGTKYGVAELVLDGNENMFTTTVVSVSPRTVESHYKGYVTFSGLKDGAEYTLIGSDGSEIELGKPAEGIIQWHPATYPSGIYRLKGHPEIEVFVN